MARPKAAGRVFYLGRVRSIPGDPVELVQFLERFEEAGGEEKHVLLRNALAGGLGHGLVASGAEGAETTAALDELLAGF